MTGQEIFFILGRAVCHQLEERTIFVLGHPLPVCARCTGIYIGIFFSFVYLTIRKKWNANQVFTVPQILFLVMCLSFFMVDGAGSYLGFWQSSNFLRIFTGCMAGFALPFFLPLILNFDVYGQNKEPIIKSLKELIVLCLVEFLFCMGVYRGSVFPYGLTGGIISAGIFLLFTTLATVFLKLFFRRFKNNRLFFMGGAGAVFLIGIFSSIGKMLKG